MTISFGWVDCFWFLVGDLETDFLITSLELDYTTFVDQLLDSETDVLLVLRLLIDFLLFGLVFLLIFWFSGWLELSSLILSSVFTTVYSLKVLFEFNWFYFDFGFGLIILSWDVIAGILGSFFEIVSMLYFRFHLLVILVMTIFSTSFWQWQYLNPFLTIHSN